MKAKALVALSQCMGDSSHAASAISQLAGRQHGHLTRAQLLDLGADDSWIHRRTQRGLLLRVHHGVYAVGYRRPEPIARAMAAVLACGPRALLSHDSAAALWGWRRWPRTPEVMVPGDRRPRGIRVHRTATLTLADRGWQLGVPVTCPERTMRDIRSRLTVEQWRRTVSDARLQKQVSEEAVLRLLGYGPGPTRSEMRDRFQRAVIDRFGLPQPLTDTRVNGFEVDAVWPGARVIVELDGWGSHGGRQAFIADRERDAIHVEAGYVVVRITWERLRDDPRREAERLLRILAARAILNRAQ